MNCDALKHIMHRVTLLTGLSLFLGLTPALAAQDTTGRPVDTVESLSGIEIVTSVDRAEVLIGDLINYTLAITYDSVYELVPPPLGANLGAFDVKDYESDLVTRLDNGRIRSESKFKVSTFTTGEYVIPPIPVLFRLPDSTGKVLFSEPVPIKVNSLLENAGDSVDIKPLKAPYEFERDLTAYYYGGGALLLFLLVLAWYLWRRSRRVKAGAEPVDLRKPWEIAFENLAVLQQKRLPAEGKFKEYYFEITDIVRSYMGRIYEVDVMEMTTEEWSEVFAEITMPDGTFETGREFFKHADLVKFAKFIPEVVRAENDLETAHHLVETIRVDYERRQRRTMETQVTDIPEDRPKPEEVEAP